MRAFVQLFVVACVAAGCASRDGATRRGLARWEPGLARAAEDHAADIDDGALMRGSARCA